MSRLIDADKIEYTHTTARSNDDWHIWDVACVTKDEIVDMPTVKAIPIEWFKNLIKTVEDSKNYEESEILKWVLNKWENQEKENEREIDRH